MEQFASITERRPRYYPAIQPQATPRPSRAPLYASPWIALFVILRRGLRQNRLLES